MPHVRAAVDPATITDSSAPSQVECAPRGQRHLDFAWSVILGGIAGELLGMCIGRFFLNVWVMYATAALGMLLPFCAAGNWAQRVTRTLGPAICDSATRVFRFATSFIKVVPRGKALLADDCERFLKYFAKQRRWIACENVARRFLAENAGNVTSPRLAGTVKAIAPGIVYAHNQLLALVWFVVGGLLYTFIAWRVDLLGANLAEQVKGTVPLLFGKAFISEAFFGAFLWFVLLAFAMSVTLLALGRPVPKSSFGWAVTGCLGVILFPLAEKGLDAFSATEFLNTNQGLLRGVQKYLGPCLAKGSGVFLLLTKTGFLYSAWGAFLDKVGQPKGRLLPPLLLCACVFIANYYQTSAFVRFLPESLCFLFLAAVSGGLHMNRQDAKRPYWELMPCGGVVISALDLRLESSWLAMLSVAVALLVTGFLVSLKKSLGTLWLLVKVAFVVIPLCQCVRWYGGSSANAILANSATWAAVGSWCVCVRLGQFDATVPILDRLRKGWLRRIYRRTDFGKPLITDTDWYRRQPAAAAGIKDARKGHAGAIATL